MTGTTSISFQKKNVIGGPRPLKKKRPLVHIIGHTYDFCFHKHRVKRVLRLLLCQDPVSVTG